MRTYSVGLGGADRRQIFVGEDIQNAAAYDSQTKPVLWMERNPYVKGSASADRYDNETMALAKVIADALSASKLSAPR